MIVKILIKYHTFMYRLKATIFGVSSARAQPHLGRLVSIGLSEAYKKSKR